MISKQQFKAQISRLGTLFMRETPNDMLREMYEIFKEKDFTAFEKTVSDIIRNEDRFPSPNTIQGYYETNMPKRELPEPLEKEDLERAAKTLKHKHYLNLIFGLMEGEINIEDDKAQKCFKEQGSKPTFSHYDIEKKCFIKPWRNS